jgi:hypothetical protein
MVMGLRLLTGADPKGECELHRIVPSDSVARDMGDEVCCANIRARREAVRRVLMSTRDIVRASVIWCWWVFLRLENFVESTRTMRISVWHP